MWVRRKRNILITARDQKYYEALELDILFIEYRENMKIIKNFWLHLRLH
jgi:hypothetical protein